EAPASSSRPPEPSGPGSAVVAVRVRGLRADTADEEIHAAQVAEAHAVPERVEGAGIRLGPPGRGRVLVMAGVPVVQGEPTAPAGLGRGDAEQVFHAGAAARAVGPVGRLGPARVAADLALLRGGHLEVVV